MGKRQQRAMELMKRLLELEAETAKIQSELDELIPDKPVDSTRGPRPRKAANTKPVMSSKPVSGAGNGSSGIDWGARGALTKAIREYLRKDRSELTTRQIAEKAGVPSERMASAKAAISRMLADGEIEAGATAGTYRAKLN